MMPPLKFIPIAEESNLIIEIGGWVLCETCRQGRLWLDEGLPPLTLPISAKCHLRFSITGSQGNGFFSHATGIGNNRKRIDGQSRSSDGNLRTQGIRLAIDDFSTGYSSLAYLKHFLLDILKIDKSFIDDIPFHQDDIETAAAIVAMGHILGFKALAEGVETQEQLAFLREKGCDSYQCYIKSKPIPADQFAELLRKQQRDEL
jgi:EAL domain-containing protein (putative c-di-GMP-specific phosphodiesterase class I)